MNNTVNNIEAFQKQRSQIAFSSMLASLLGLVLLFAAGCSDPPTTADVTGSVSVDGVPVESGSIGFFPLDGKSPTAGAAIEAGRYTAQVPFGKSKVEIRVSKVVGKKKLYDTADSPVQSIMAEALPPKYNDESELQMDVALGMDEQNFELKTK